MEIIYLSNSTMSQPMPVVVCGKHAHIAKFVKERLQPEYEGNIDISLL